MGKNLSANTIFTAIVKYIIVIAAIVFCGEIGNIIFSVYKTVSGIENVIIKTAEEFIFYYSLTAVLKITLVLILIRQFSIRFRDFGLFPKNIVREILLGLIFGVIIFIFQTTLSIFIGRILPMEYTKGDSTAVILAGIFNRSFSLGLIAAFLAGLTEEFARVFAVLLFKKYFKLFPLMIIIYSLYFGYHHLYQGITAVFTTALFSMILCLIFLWRKNIFIVILIHFLYDLLALMSIHVLSN